MVSVDGACLDEVALEGVGIAPWRAGDADRGGGYLSKSTYPSLPIRAYLSESTYPSLPIRVYINKSQVTRIAGAAVEREAAVRAGCVVMAVWMTEHKVT